MIAGIVNVDDNGTVSAVPNDATNCAYQLFLLLVASSQTDTIPQTTITPPSVSIDSSGNVSLTNAQISTSNVPVSSMQSDSAKATSLKAQAKIANTFASWMVSYLTAQASATIIIAADSTGDGLQTSTTVGTATTHPAIGKVLIGTIS